MLSSRMTHTRHQAENPAQDTMMNAFKGFRSLAKLPIYSGVAVRHHDENLFISQRARNSGPTEMLCDEFSDGQPGLDVGQRLTL
jgi:hypothetical protein